MSRAHADDPWSQGIGRTPFARAAPSPKGPIAGKRVTVIRRLTAGSHLDPDCESRLEEAIAFLDKGGAKLRELDGPAVDWKLDAARLILRANQITRFGELLGTRRNELDPSFVRTLEEGAGVDVATLRQGLFDRTAIYKTVQRLFAEADLLLTPTVATPAPPATQDQFAPLMVDGKPIGDLRSAWYSYPIPFNMTGHPAISIPVGRSRHGLPIGVQVVAPWFAEESLIGLAEAFDAHTGASTTFPPGFGPG